MPSRLHALVLALAVSLPMPAASRAQRQDPADLKEIEAYRLTEPALKKVIAVNRSMVQEILKDPKARQAITLRQELERLEEKDDPTPADETRMDDIRKRLEQLDAAVDPLGGDASSLAEMEAQMAKYPPMAAALAREGMTPREYATFWLAFMQAAFVHGFQKSGLLKELPPGVSPENVQFIADHGAEIDAMQKELEALGTPPR